MALVGIWATRWGDWNAFDASKLVATGIAIVAGTVIYRLAMDDPRTRGDAIGHGHQVHHHWEMLSHGAPATPVGSAAMFAELLASPGVVEDVELRSSFGVMAFHGGSLERRTDEIARRVADAAGASRYSVALPEDLRWHVPSRFVDPAVSPALAAFVDHIDVAMAVHGYGRDGWWTTVLLGGTNRALATHVGAYIARGLPDYDVVEDLARVPAELRGLHPDNPVNRCRAGGVQVELPPRARGRGPRGRESTVDALVDALAAATATWR